MRAAAIFEAPLNRDQAAKLAELIREAKPIRPEGVIDVRLYAGDDVGRLVSLWESRERLESYLRSVEVPRGTELMRAVGAEPVVFTADVPVAE